MRIAKRGDWKTMMPDEWRATTLDRTYTADEFARITLGRVPEVMEDKWFIFFEEPWLYFIRSWTGFCLYKVQFAELERGMRVADAWAHSGYSHCDSLEPDDPQQPALDLMELAALVDRQAGRPTKELWRQYFDAVDRARPIWSGRIRVNEVVYRWKARKTSPGLRIAVRSVERAGAMLILRTKQEIAPRHVQRSQLSVAIQNACAAGWKPQEPGPHFKRVVSL